MCGRYTLDTDTEVVETLFEIDETPRLRARFNIAPTQQAPVVWYDADAESGGRVISEFRWGLVPFWADDEKIGNRMINARIERVEEVPVLPLVVHAFYQGAPFPHAIDAAEDIDAGCTLLLNALQQTGVYCGNEIQPQPPLRLVRMARMAAAVAVLAIMSLAGVVYMP